ncbi:hypothetical protein AAC387_Pa06g0417 [Persea americana]
MDSASRSRAKPGKYSFQSSMAVVVGGQVDLGFDVSSLGTRSAREFCFGWRDGIPSIDWLLVEDEEGMR